MILRGTAPTTCILHPEQAIGREYASWLSEDHDVYVATTVDGAEGRHLEADVVVVNWILPDGGVLDVLEELREREDRCCVLAIADDGGTDPFDGRADDLLVRPVDAEEFRRAVERLSLLKRYDDLLRELFRRSARAATEPGADDLSSLRQRADELREELLDRGARDLFDAILDG